MGRKVLVVFCLFLAVVQRAIGQSPIGRALPCEAPDKDPDPQNPKDNLSCLVQNPSMLICYSKNQICDYVFDCVGGIKGNDLLAFDCGKFCNVRVVYYYFDSNQSKQKDSSSTVMTDPLYWHSTITEYAASTIICIGEL